MLVLFLYIFLKTCLWRKTQSETKDEPLASPQTTVLKEGERQNSAQPING